ncbi:glycoside hydrolase family 117 protein [Saccharicrinis aurantiacus]|uniref:glycoside hydrolase family 117 protein n=1 Tax=Saccharicrinis aurantiacus TaxID=1849719 RepID=UPI00248FB9CD|nr:hypothetical protein [Saccharicrinis aurantiacus]
MKKLMKKASYAILALGLMASCAQQKHEQKEVSNGVFPFAMPDEKPNIPLSASSERMFEYETKRVQDNELFSQFKYTRLQGFDYNGGDGTVSRRDPSRPILVDGKYYIWYTKRHTIVPPVGWDRAKEATDEIPSTDWDLADIWYATSADGTTWNEIGPAVTRPAKPKSGWRSLATPDILVWQGKYYLYYQAFDEPSGLRGDLCPVSVSYANSPDGPWTHGGDAVIPFGKEGEWDQNATHDPHPIIFNGKIHIYYKAAYNKWPDKRDKYAVGHGLVTSDNPLGPFEKHPLNPVMQSGHETTYFPFRDGVATIVIKDGNERETIQFSEDGANFNIACCISFAPTAAAPYIPNLFEKEGGNRGFTWGLSHFVNAGTPEKCYSIMARFDCDLSLDSNEPGFKKTGVWHRPEVYFEQSMESLYNHPEGRYKKEK